MYDLLTFSSCPPSGSGTGSGLDFLSPSLLPCSPAEIVSDQVIVRVSVRMMMRVRMRVRLRVKVRVTVTMRVMEPHEQTNQLWKKCETNTDDGERQNAKVYSAQKV